MKKILKAATAGVALTMLTAVGYAQAAQTGPVAVAARINKVLVIVEENHAYGQVIGSPDAPYLNTLAATYGSAVHMDAGYPVRCPSLVGYLVLTSGSTHGICDDKAPKHHPLSGDNVFRQVRAAGLQWRDYAESAPGRCALANGPSPYMVRHVPATYYLADRADCARWVVPMGTDRHGALYGDVAAGQLPAYGFVSPDACHDMHGARPCPDRGLVNGDAWLHGWLPTIMAGPDYRAGRLTIIITWDEGTSSDNHIPTLVIAPTVRHVRASGSYTHCSTLRLTEDLLRLPRLGCAATAPSMAAEFRF